MVIEPTESPCRSLRLKSSKDKDLGEGSHCMSLLGQPIATNFSSLGGSFSGLDKTRLFPLSLGSKVFYPSEGQPKGPFSKPSKGNMGKKAERVFRVPLSMEHVLAPWQPSPTPF